MLILESKKVKKCIRHFCAAAMVSILFLTTIMICSYFTVSASVDGVFVDENFKNMDIGSPASPSSDGSTNEGWISYDRSGSGTVYGQVSVESDPDASMNKVSKIFRFPDGNSLNYAWFGYFRPNGFPGKILSVDFMVKCNPYNGNKQREIFSVGSDKDTNTKDAAYFEIINGELKYYANSSDLDLSDVPNVPYMQPGQWYNIRIIINQSSKTYDFYIEENRISENAVPRLLNIPLYNPQANFYGIRMFKYQIYRDGKDSDPENYPQTYAGGNTYLDDIKIAAPNACDYGTAGWKEDFENMTIGATPAPRTAPPSEGWNAYTKSGSGTVYGEVAYSNDVANTSVNKAVKVYRYTTGSTDNSVRLNYYKADGLSSNRFVTVQFRFKSVPADLAKQREYFSVSSLHNNYDDRDAAYISLVNGNFYYRTLSSPITEIPISNAPSFVSGKWYGIKLVVDTQNRTYDVYIDNEFISSSATPLITNIPLMGDTGSPIKDFVYGLWRDGSVATSSGGWTYLDDFIIDPNPVSSPVVNFIGMGGDPELTLEGIQNVDVSVDTISYISGVHVKAEIIGALYDPDGVLVAVYQNNDSLNAVTGEISKGIDLSNHSNLQGHKLKLFLWDDMNMMRPYVAPTILPTPTLQN